MAAELKVGIGVEAEGLDKGLKQTEDKLQKFGKTVTTETKKVGASFTGMSRVLQDAAFGPGAIANNLAGLGDDFKQLSAQAKESGQSLGKTLVQSLAGPGGLNLAIAGLTLGMSLASFGMSAWTRMFKSNTDEANDNKEAIKKYNDELKSFAESLGAVTQARLKGSQNAQNELTDLKALFTAYQNGNLPLEQRKNAYEALQQQYPDYFKNIAFEEKASNKAKDAYNRLTASILATAQARAFNDKITKNTEEKLTLEEKEISIFKELTDVNNKLAKAEDAALAASQSRSKTDGQFAIAQGKANDLREKRTALEKEYTQVMLEQRGIVAQNAQLAERVQTLIGEGAEIIDKASEKTAKAAERIKDIPWAKTIKGQAKDSELVADDMVGNIKKTLDGLGRIQPKIVIPQALIDFNKTLQDKVVIPIIELGPVLTQAATEAFAGIGIAIGEALATGQDLAGSLGKTLLSTMGSLLIQLGKMGIEVGVGLLGIRAAFQSLNPALAIAAGVALVALGSAFAASAKGMGNQIGGGGGTAPTAMYRGFQATAPSGAFAGGGGGQANVRFEISGQNLVGVLTRAQASNSRQGI